MIAKIEGECIGVGESTFDKQKYPFFEILQRGDGRRSSEVIRISGNGFKVGEKASFTGWVYVSDNGDLKVKRIDEEQTSASGKKV